jgi:DNA invertase Pin-like site-specific DNA recombinase
MGTATGRLIFTIIGAIASFECEMMLERQRHGIGQAKGERRCRGRKPPAGAKAVEIEALLVRVSVGATEIAKRPDLGRAWVCRVLSARAH